VVVFGCYVYVGILVLLLSVENWLLFPGASDRGWLPPPANLAVREIELLSATGDRIHAWFSAPPSWTPQQGAILYSHGNGGNLSHRAFLIQRWRKELNRAVLIYDYPGYGKSAGRPTETGCYEAGEAAYRWLVEDQKVPAHTLLFLGSSLGGAVATELATRHECLALVLCSPFTSFPDMAHKSFPWLPGRWLVRNRFDNLGKIGTIDCPVFITHGKADRLIPLWMSERLHASANEPKQFMAIADLGHGQPHQAEFFTALRTFLDRTSNSRAGDASVLQSLEHRFLFPGAHDREWLAPPSELAVREIDLICADDTRIHAWFTAPANWRPAHGAILYSHGNGGNLSHRSLSVHRWRREFNRAVLIYDYPGYGKSSGRPTETGCYEAGAASWRWLVHEQKVPTRKVLLLGSSLGGAISTELATRQDCEMLVLCSTFTSFPDMAQKTIPWLPRWLVQTRLDNLAKIGKVGSPVFITHGTADRLIPHAMSERLYASAREPKRFLSLVNHGHAHPHQTEFYTALKGFLTEINRD
jgi:hypothetical protein